MQQPYENDFTIRFLQSLPCIFGQMPLYITEDELNELHNIVIFLKDQDFNQDDIKKLHDKMISTTLEHNTYIPLLYDFMNPYMYSNFVEIHEYNKELLIVFYEIALTALESFKRLRNMSTESKMKILETIRSNYK